MLVELSARWWGHLDCGIDQHCGPHFRHCVDDCPLELLPLGHLGEVLRIVCRVGRPFTDRLKEFDKRLVLLGREYVLDSLEAEVVLG